MTDLITADEATKLLDAATPGPWEADGDPWNRIIWSSAENRVCFMAHSNGLDDARDIATSNLIAAAPDLARTVIALHAQLADAIRSLAPIDGLALVRELRDRAEKAEAERDRLAAANAVLEAKVAGLVGKLHDLEDATDMAINRAEALCDKAWNGDARDFKRSMVGVFAEYQTARRATSERAS